LASREPLILRRESKNVFRREKPLAAMCNTATQAPRAGNMVVAVLGTFLDCEA
jgi:hypothetical protein